MARCTVAGLSRRRSVYDVLGPYLVLCTNSLDGRSLDGSDDVADGVDHVRLHAPRSIEVRPAARLTGDLAPRRSRAAHPLLGASGDVACLAAQRGSCRSLYDGHRQSISLAASTNDAAGPARCPGHLDGLRRCSGGVDLRCRREQRPQRPAYPAGRPSRPDRRQRSLGHLIASRRVGSRPKGRAFWLARHPPFSGAHRQYCTTVGHRRPSMGPLRIVLRLPPCHGSNLATAIQPMIGRGGHEKARNQCDPNNSLMTRVCSTDV